LFGFNVVYSNRKINVSEDDLSIYVHLSGSLFGVDFNDVNFFSFFFISEESKEASNEKVELNDKFLVGDIVRLKIKNEF
jgi:ataxia telangiectasia mutated family protein